VTDSERQLLELIHGQLQLQTAALRQIAAALAPKIGSDDEHDEALLKAIETRLSGFKFTATELIVNAELIRAQGREGDALYKAVIGAIGGLSARKLGIHLSALEGRPIAGLVVKRVKNGRDGVFWTVTKK
jgi:hypothetical protein